MLHYAPLSEILCTIYINVILELYPPAAGNNVSNIYFALTFMYSDVSIIIRSLDRFRAPSYVVRFISKLFYITSVNIDTFYCKFVSES